MELKKEGELGKDELYKPDGAEWKVKDVQYHHMIPWWVLRRFWNALVSKVMPEKGKWRDVGHHKAEMEQYMTIVGFTRNPPAIAEAIRKGKLEQENGDSVDDLARKLCWQPYNIALGPRTNERLGHAADPGGFMDAVLVAKEHMERVGRLNAARVAMEEYIKTTGVMPLGKALAQLEEVCTTQIIPEHDINWYALDHYLFLQLSESERRIFHQACKPEWGTGDSNAIYRQLFPDKT